MRGALGMARAIRDHASETLATKADLVARWLAGGTRLEAVPGIPIDIVWTGPGREAVIVRRHPFD